MSKLHNIIKIIASESGNIVVDNPVIPGFGSRISMHDNTIKISKAVCHNRSVIIPNVYYKSRIIHVHAGESWDCFIRRLANVLPKNISLGTYTRYDMATGKLSDELRNIYHDMIYANDLVKAFDAESDRISACFDRIMNDHVIGIKDNIIDKLASSPIDNVPASAIKASLSYVADITKICNGIASLSNIASYISEPIIEEAITLRQAGKVLSS